MRTVDLNCDLGEGAGRDAELLRFVSSANVACGGHAGDDATMRTAVALACQHRVDIGAHPGFRDPHGFGRLERPTSPAEVYDVVLEQTRRLQRIAAEHGARVTHLKPHGALYHLAARSAPLARAVAAAAVAADPQLRLYGLAGSASLRSGQAAGLAVANEVFADRTYQADGSLTPRGQPGALIDDVEAAAAQVRRLVLEGCVRAVDGTDVLLAADTVCVHGDGPQAVAFVRRLRLELEAAGIAVRPIRLC